MKSKDLEMCKINKTKINNYLSPVRSFSMYSIVSRYHYNEWIYAIWDIAGLDWLMCDLLNVVYQLVCRVDLTWLDFFTYWSDLCIHDNLVQQIDLFLHISLGRISFLLDLHVKCLNGLMRYLTFLTFILWSTWIIVHSLTLLVLEYICETGQLHHSCSICTTN